jgi:tetrapyrrole methylase family protein/MazG family protein
MADELARLVAIVARLRGPRGCPWDREQTHRSILSCLIDECYELAEAIEHRDLAHMREELGDLLLQIALHSQMAAEASAFTLQDVAHDINEKLIRRHPHVFGDESARTAGEVARNWERIKKREKGKADRDSLLDGIPRSLPALLRAQTMQRKAAQVGFDWADIDPALDKVEEEFAEFREALHNKDFDHASEELGDIMFALVNVARHRGITAEDALRGTIDKFARRFRFIEERYRRTGESMEHASLEELDAVWEESKKSDPPRRAH